MTARRAIAVTTAFTMVLGLPPDEVLAHGRSVRSLGLIVAVASWVRLVVVVWHDRFRTSRRAEREVRWPGESAQG
jgi:hypothetical protein